jgi:hypothetical protein
MSYEEKGTWVHLTVSLGTFLVYVAVILRRADGGPLAEVAYVAPMLWALGAGIVAAMVARVAVEIVRPSDSHRGDIRDKEIDRHGQYLGFYALAIGFLPALVLTMLEAAYFWIANAIYAAYVLNAVSASVAKLVAYRRGM